MIGDSFLRKTLFSIGLSWCLLGSLQAQDCPDRATFEVVHEQTPNGKGGEITVTFTGLHGDIDPFTGKFQYHLWNRNTGFVYDQGKMDPGFNINPDITFSFHSPGTVTFGNVPPQSGYVVILTSPDCRGKFQPEAGEITIKAFNK